MYSSSIRPETTTPYSQYDRRLSYSGDHQQSYSYAHRSHYEPPRPLEPRPTLHASLSDTASLHRRQESYRPVGGISGNRPPGPSLPGLRDILTPAATSSGNGSYSSSWQTPTSVSAQSHARYASSYVHPPMVLEPHASAPQDRRPRSWEVPIHPSLPEPSQAAHAMPPSPYASYQPNYGQSSDHRYERTAPTPVMTQLGSAVPSPYSGVAPEGSPFGGAVAGYDRDQHSATSAENQKKYLGINEVPGEGAFHVYEGGYRIPTHVDGEHVNPAWGLTKANKPRKRLALACLDCREKKIKCEPGASSCLQCEKAKRPCRRTPAQLSQAESATSTDWSPSGPSHSRNKASVSDPTPAPSRDIEPETLSKRRSREDPSPPNVPNKKHRSASPLSTTIRDAPLPMRGAPVAVGESTVKQHGPANHAGVLSWEHDPYEVEPEITLQLLHLYFAHFNNATYCLYPQQHFMQWLKTHQDKCHNERMVLYAMLAMASIFADESLSGFGRQCARVALEILPLQVGNIHMCTAQARTLLAIYSFARGEHSRAWELSGAAIRAVQHLGYHTEQGCIDHSAVANQSRTEFGFSATQHTECKRRTFWSAFFMDRYCQGAMTTLKPQDVFLRLPCTEEMYERGLPSDAPYLNNGIIDPIKALLTAGSPLAPMAWHVLVAAIWGDVIDFIFRAPHQATASYREAYESFYSDTWNRLQGLMTRLPDYLQYSTANLHKSIQHGYFGILVSIHAVYHLCCMKLNRCLRHSLAQDLITRNIKAAHEHGHQMLQLVRTVNAAQGETDMQTDGNADRFAFSTPFPGYAILAAVDIVSAGGTDSALGSTLEEISGGLHCLLQLSNFWSSAKEQARLCERRYYQIQNILKNPSRARGGAWIGRKWGLEKSLEQDLSPDDDCIYGLGGSNEALEIYFDAFGDSAGQSKASTGGLRIA